LGDVFFLFFSLGGTCVISRFGVIGIGLDVSLGRWMGGVGSCGLSWDVEGGTLGMSRWMELSSGEKMRKRGFGVCQYVN